MNAVWVNYIRRGEVEQFRNRFEDSPSVTAEFDVVAGALADAESGDGVASASEVDRPIGVAAEPLIESRPVGKHPPDAAECADDGTLGAHHPRSGGRSSRLVDDVGVSSCSYKCGVEFSEPFDREPAVGIAEDID